MFESGLSDGLARTDWGWAGRQESVSSTDAPGASLAYAMSRDDISPGKKIVLLEAKDVASGACKWLRAILPCARPGPVPSFPLVRFPLIPLKPTEQGADRIMSIIVIWS